MKGIRVGLQGLLLVACAQVLPAQGGSITLNAVAAGEAMRQGTFPASPTDVYSHSPVLQALSYQFIGFNPSGTGMEDQSRSGYLVYDLSGVGDEIVDVALEFDVTVADVTPGELTVNTIAPSALDAVVAAPVGPLTQAQFDTVFAALTSGVSAASQVLTTGSTMVSIALGPAGISHLSSAMGLVGFHVLYAANRLQDLALAIDVAPTLVVTTAAAPVPLPGTVWLMAPWVLSLILMARHRRSR